MPGRRAAALVKYPILSALSVLTSPCGVAAVGRALSPILAGSGPDRAHTGLSRAKAVLVVRLDDIGDMVLMSPFLRELRRNLPNAWITLVVKPSVLGLAELCPYVNEVVAFDPAATGRLAALRQQFRALGFAAQSLWRRRFDLAIAPRWDVDYYRTAFLVYFSGAPCRIGYSEKATEHKRLQNDGYDRLFTHIVDDTGEVKHEVERNLDVIRFLGGRVQDDRLELWVGPEDELFADRLMRSQGVQSGEILIAICPGARDPKRAWPVENFLQLGVALAEAYPMRAVLVGDEKDRRLCGKLREMPGRAAIDMMGRATLRQTAAVLKRCRLYIGNDTGPMHMAAAAGAPVVEISCHSLNGAAWLSNSPRRFAPWGKQHAVLQPAKALPPCTDHCMATEAHCIRGVSVDGVKAAVAQILQRRPPRAESSQ